MAATATKNGKRVGLSLAEVNAKFNPNVIVPNKIKAALKELGDQALPSEEFRAMAGISTLQLATFAPQFEEFQVPVKDNGRPRVLWCGSEKFALAVREELER